MPGPPTYVIGAGGVGVDIVERLHRKRGIDGDLGLMAVDSDGGRLDELPPDIPRIHLTSDDGLVGEFVDSFPFLSEGLSIPEGDASGRRPVGRYKFDNLASPEYRNYYQEITEVLQNAFIDRSTALGSPAAVGHCNVVLVTSFGGGTGSGVFPLLATIVDTVGRGIEGLELGLVGIGVVPPLDFDPERESPPADPYTYPNTYEALRDLATLLDTDSERPLRLPIYSTVEPTALGSDPDLRRAVDRSGTVFELESPPFDAFWLVSSTQGSDGPTRLRGDLGASVSVVADAVDALDRCGSVRGEWHRNSATDGTARFGTIGYAALRVPHEELRGYCRRKRTRDELRARLERTSSRLAELDDEREQLRAARNTGADSTADSSGWVERVGQRLEPDSEPESEPLLAAPLSEFEAVLDGFEAELRMGPYVSLLLALDRAFSRGELRRATIPDLEETCQEVREAHELEQLAGDVYGEAPLGKRFERLDAALRERIQQCQRRLEEAEYGIRDVLPPEHDLLTSRRERLEARLERLRADRERLSAAAESFDAYQEKATLVAERLADARSRIDRRLEEIEQKVEHTRRRRDRLQEELDDCETEVSSLRDSVTEPTTNGPEFVLPVTRDTLSELSMADVENELTSIEQYQEHDLLPRERTRLVEWLQRTVDSSCTWPDSISEHDPSMVVAASEQETYVLCDERNRSLVSDLLQSVSTSGDLWPSSHPEVGFSGDPFRIEAVSIASKGCPESLVGYQWLTEQAVDGVLDAYRNAAGQQQALAYPEWYESDLESG